MKRTKEYGPVRKAIAHLWEAKFWLAELKAQTRCKPALSVIVTKMEDELRQVEERLKSSLIDETVSDESVLALGQRFMNKLVACAFKLLGKKTENSNLNCLLSLSRFWLGVLIDG